MFDRFIDLFADFDFLDIVFYSFCFLFAVISFIRTGRSSKNINKILEVYKELKYRLPNYREFEDSPSQSFDTEVVRYRLNKSTHELEPLPDKVDIQQVVQSAENMALPNMLQHLEPVDSPLDEAIDLHDDLLDKLDYFREADAYRLSLCEKYNLSPKLSLSQVVSKLSDEAEALRDRISDFQNSQKKEVVVNESSQVDSVE